MRDIKRYNVFSELFNILLQFYFFAPSYEVTVDENVLDRSIRKMSHFRIISNCAPSSEPKETPDAVEELVRMRAVSFISARKPVFN